MRALLALLLTTSAATAWEVSSDGPICLLTHATDDAVITVSHDPRQGDPYAIEVVRSGEAWARGSVFIIRFDGPNQLTISTSRYVLSDDGFSLRVADKGFGNVLAGMAQNFVGVAVLGGKTVLIPLVGAPPKVAAFEACVSATKV